MKNKLIGLLLVVPWTLAAQSGPFNGEELLDLARERSGEQKLLDNRAEQSRYETRATRALKGPVISARAAYSFLGLPPSGVTLEAGELGIIPDMDGPGPLEAIPLPSEETVFLEDTDHHYYSFSLVLTQPLYTWGKLDAALEAARTQEKATLLAADEGEVLISAEVATIISTLYYLEETDRFLSTQEDLMPRLLEITGKSLAQGFLLEQDLLEVKVTAQRIKTSRRELENSRRSLLDRLEQLTGLEELNPADLLLADPPEPADKMIPARDVLWESALSSNWSLKKLQAAADARKQLALAAAREKGGLPDLGFSLSLEYGDDGLPFSEDEATSGFSATATLALEGTILTGGRERAEWELARAREEEARISRENALISLEREIDTALRDLELLKDRILLEKLTGEKIAREIEVKEDLWQTGAAGEEELIMKELEYLTSSLAGVALKADFYRRYYELTYLTGENHE